MVTFWNNRYCRRRRSLLLDNIHTNNVIQRGGKQLLKLAMVNKRRNKAFISLENKNILFAPTIVLPISFQPQYMATNNESNDNNSKNRKIRSTIPTNFGSVRFFEKKSRSSSSSTSVSIADKKKQGSIIDDIIIGKREKNISIKKLFRYNRNRRRHNNKHRKMDIVSSLTNNNTPPMATITTTSRTRTKKRIISTKVASLLSGILGLENHNDDNLSSVIDYSGKNNLLSPTGSTTPTKVIISTPTKKSSNNNGKTETIDSHHHHHHHHGTTTATTTTPLRYNDHVPTTPSTASTSGGRSVTTDPRVKKKKEKGTIAYIFFDEDDEDREHKEEGEEEEDDDSDDNSSVVSIECQLDREMRILDERIRDQKVEERTLAGQQLLNTTSSSESSCCCDDLEAMATATRGNNINAIISYRMEKVMKDHNNVAKHLFEAELESDDEDNDEKETSENCYVSFSPSSAFYLQAMEGYTAKAKADIEQATALAMSKINTASPTFSHKEASREDRTDKDEHRENINNGDDNNNNNDKGNSNDHGKGKGKRKVIQDKKQEPISTNFAITMGKYIYRDNISAYGKEDENGEEDIQDKKQESACTNVAITLTKSISKQQLSVPQERTKCIGRQLYFYLLLIIIILVILLISNFLTTMMEAPYNHEIMIDQARSFFKLNDDESVEKSQKPMMGIIVAVSETKSNLGKELADRFERLGATVASAEIDCSNLNNASETIDATFDQYRRIDFLIHTGNLCLWPVSSQSITDNVKYIVSTSLQGYDMLFAGNYISAFLMTQKLIPFLERSRLGTVVQFTSPIFSTVVDGSLLEVDTSSESNPPASKLLQNQGSFISALLYLPSQFAYVKLAEILQYQVFVRDYPNIRSIEFPLGWMNREVDGFFKLLFEAENSHAMADTGTIISSALIDDEDLQEDLYEWSQRAISKWLAIDDDFLERGDWLKRGHQFSHTTSTILHKDDKSDKISVVEYLSSGQTAAIVTGTTLAWMILKLKGAWYTGYSTVLVG